MRVKGKEPNRSLKVYKKMNEWNTFLWRTTKCLYYVWTNVFQNIVARFLRIWIVKQNESKIKDLSRSYSHCNKLCNIFIEKQTLILYWLFDVDCTWSIVHSPLSFSQTKFLRNFWFLLLFVDFSSKRNEAILVFYKKNWKSFFFECHNDLKENWFLWY